MEPIYQRNWFCSVKGIHAGELLAETTLLGTDIEAAGRLIVDQKTFEIKDACWEVHRSPENRLNGCRTVPELKGVTAYFNAGGDLRRTVGKEAGGLAREMLAECVRGIIQAETFFYELRGYPTTEAYEEYWKKDLVNSCRYFSNLHRISRKWSEYVENFSRGSNFFNRSRSCSVYRQPGGLSAVGSLCDSFHEMGVVVGLSGEGKVTAAKGSFLRAPDEVCFENMSLLKKLEGVVLPVCGKKKIAEYIGGAQGCDHLVDLVNDMGKAVAVALAGNGGSR